MKKNGKLYNVMFPVWMLLSMPQMWLAVIPANFIIDSLVLVVAMRALKLEDRMGFYSSHILKVFLLGFLADILAVVPMWLMLYLDLGGAYGDTPLLTLPGVMIAAGLIFAFDYFVSFRECEKRMRLKLALTFAVATAPYTFLIPSSWIYRY